MTAAGRKLPGRNGSLPGTRPAAAFGKGSLNSLDISLDVGRVAHLAGAKPATLSSYLESGAPMLLPPDLASMIKPNISISPFCHTSLMAPQSAGDAGKNTGLALEMLGSHLGRDFQVTNSGRQALDLVLCELDLKPDHFVTIFTATANTYVSGCVTKTIERHCKWSMGIEAATKAVLVIHEWGLPFPRMEEVCSLPYTVIEDCAYAFASAAGGKVGSQGAYAIYSLPKFFSVNFGGIACGLKRKVAAMPERYLSYLCGMLAPELQKMQETVEKRIANWRYLAELFAAEGAAPFFELADGVVPGVFMFKADERLSCEAIKAAYQQHGVECSVFYGTNAIFLPCNQSLNAGALEYLVEIYRAHKESHCR